MKRVRSNIERESTSDKSKILAHSHFYVDSSGIRYEVVGRPWFGPRKRGKRILLASALYGHECLPDHFFRYLERNYAAAMSNIEWVRFHKCTYLEGHERTWEQRFAICNTKADFKTRTILHEEGQVIANTTGWYPLVSGRRTASRRALSPPWLSASESLGPIIGSCQFGYLEAVSNVDQELGGCSFLLEFTKGAILLDVGFQYRIPESASAPAFGVVTHTHQDHCGGLELAMVNKLSIVVSESVARQLYFTGHVNRNTASLLQLRLPTSIISGDGTRFTFMPNAHTPGAMMVMVNTASKQQLLYTSDYCLRNSYYQQTPADILGLFSDSATGKWLLLDSAFLGHEPETKSDIGLDILKRDLKREHDYGHDVIVVSESADYLYCIVMWLFQTFYAGDKSQLDRHLLVEPSIIRLLETTFEPFILRQHDRYDPFMKAVLGKGMSNYLESARLYPFTQELDRLGPPRPYDIICTVPHLPRSLKMAKGDILVLIVGRLRTSTENNLRTVLKEKRSLWLHGPDFTFHSSAVDVANIVGMAAKEGIKPIIFHNFPKRVHKALDTHGISGQSYECLYSKRIRIR